MQTNPGRPTDEYANAAPPPESDAMVGRDHLDTDGRDTREGMELQAVKVEAISHKYGQRAALTEVSLSVPTRQVFGLLGPNGGGKTTLFRILSTLLTPTRGRALINGFDVAKNRAEVRKRIGVAFQSASLDKELTVMENLRCQGHLYGLRGRALSERIDGLLQRFKLADRANERAAHLSGGLQRRIDLVKAILHRPAVVLLDEPSTGLDPSARLELTDLLKEIRDCDGATVLLTTHMMDEADHCNQLAVLDQGRLVAVGTPEDLKSNVRGDVICITAKCPEQILAKIHLSFDGSAALVDQEIRIEVENGHQMIARLMESFPGQIEAVSLAKPTLEDAFVHLTGRHWGENSETLESGR